MQKNRITYIGDFKLTLSDTTIRRVSVHKKGRSVLLTDFVEAAEDILVHPSNQTTQEGWIHEYELCRDVKVREALFVPQNSIKDFDSF